MGLHSYDWKFIKRKKWDPEPKKNTGRSRKSPETGRVDMARRRHPHGMEAEAQAKNPEDCSQPQKGTGFGIKNDPGLQSPNLMWLLLLSPQCLPCFI